MSEIEQILIPLGISLITVFVAFLIKWKHDTTTLENKKDKAISNLMLEIKTTVDFIRKNPVHYEITSEGVGKARNIELDTAFYDSLVTSGLFEEYDQDFQVELSSLYTIIKSSNQLNLKLMEIIALADAGSEWYPSKLDSFSRAIQRRNDMITKKGNLLYEKLSKTNSFIDKKNKKRWWKF